MGELGRARKQACADLIYIVGGAEHGQRWW